LQAAIRPLLPRPDRRFISRLFIDRKKQPVRFPAGLRQELVGLYRDDIILLQRLIQRDLSAWLADEPVAERRPAA
jgi:hypothetical protein